MIYVQFISAILFIVTVNYSHQKKLPQFITRCKYSTDGVTLGECIKNVFYDNKEKFIGGIPEMHIPVLDPFVVERIDFNTGHGTAVGINAVFTNVQIEGARDVMLYKVESDIQNGNVILELRIPKLRIKSNYVLDGRIMILPINGTGHSEGNYTDLHATNFVSGKFVTRNNKKYIEWTDQKINLTIGGGVFNFDNLFNGNKELTESTNKVINENFVDILKELQPLVEETITSITFTILQRVFHTFSLDELFEL